MYINPIFKTSVAYPINYKNNKNVFSLTTKVSFKGDYFDYEQRLKEKLNARTKWQKFWGTGKKKAEQAVNSELIGFNIHQGLLVKKVEDSIKDKEALLKQKEESIKLMEEKQNLLNERYEMALQSHAKDEIILDLKKQLEDIKRTTNEKKMDYAKEVEKINILKQEQEILTKRESGRGWDRIAGYKTLKTQLEEAFINKLPLEKSGYEVNLPNGILLYGQHGTGKTRFAEAFAQEANCNFVSIETLNDSDEIIEEIRSALRKSKKNYYSKETPKKRTIILLDDFNAIAKLSNEEKLALESEYYDFEDTTVGQLVDLLKDCANKYKATIFMTTNHPKKIESELLNSNLIPYQIFLGPPNPNDAAQIFKYHTQNFTQQEIDYTKLGYGVAKAIDNNEAYSAQGIVNVVEHAKEKSKGGQITESNLLESINEVKPDITSKTFYDFYDEMIDLIEKTSKQTQE